MIKSFFFHQFKSFSQTELNLTDLTILIGSNGSGKSNLTEALRILAESATGQPLAIITDGSRNVGSVIRGGSIGCPQVPHTSFELGCTFECEDYNLIYRITISTKKGVQVEKESLIRLYANGDKKEEIFSVSELKDGYLSVTCLSDKFDDYKRQISVSPYVSVLSQIGNLLPTDSKMLIHGHKDAKALAQSLSKIFFFQPRIELMRDYVRIGEETLNPNGANLSAVLYALCQMNGQSIAVKENILSIIRNLPDNEIEDIAFIKTALNDVIFFLKEKYNEYPMDAKQLSDGTLRCLAIVALIFSEKPNSIIVMEEPDNGVHPSRVKRLLQAVCRVAKERQLTLLFTTHNPILMDAADAYNAEDVVICYRDKNDGNSHFRRMVDFPDYFRLATKGSTGNLARNDEFVKSLSRPSEDPQAFYDWLERAK